LFSSYISLRANHFVRAVITEERSFEMPEKRNLDAFFGPAKKKARPDTNELLDTASGQLEVRVGDTKAIRQGTL
jgi:hypothetical protein